MAPLEFLGTLPDYFWLHYDVLLNRWKRYCNKLDVILFDEIEDSVDAFCRCIGIDQSGLTRLEDRANASLSPASLEIVRRLGMYDLSEGTRGAVLRTVRAFESKHSDGGGAVFPASVKTLIMDRFEASNGRLTTILGRQGQVLFPPPVTAAVASGDLPGGATLLQDFVGPLLRVLDRSARRKEKAP
jgi:hypothetical protein